MHLEWSLSRDDRIHSRCGGNYSGCTVEPGRGVTSWYQSGDRVFGIRLESRLCQSPVLSQPKFAKIDLSRYSAELSVNFWSRAGDRAASQRGTSSSVLYRIS